MITSVNITSPKADSNCCVVQSLLFSFGRCCCRTSWRFCCCSRPVVVVVVVVVVVIVVVVVVVVVYETSPQYLLQHLFQHSLGHFGIGYQMLEKQPFKLWHQHCKQNRAKNLHHVH